MESRVFKSILHPIRMKIIQTLLKNGKLTVKEISQELSDVPKASLYRHINALVNDNIIDVYSEKKIRGTLEKTYIIKEDPYSKVNEEAIDGSKQVKLDLFYNYMISLLSDFENYMSGESIDLEKDIVGFRSVPIYLSDEECLDFLKDLSKAFEKVIDNKSNEVRKLRKFSTIIMPVKDSNN